VDAVLEVDVLLKQGVSCNSWTLMISELLLR